MIGRQCDPSDRLAMDGKRLKQLRPMANSLWMLNNHSDGTAAGTVSDFNPISTKTFK